MKKRDEETNRDHSARTRLFVKHEDIQIGEYDIKKKKEETRRADRRRTQRLALKHEDESILQGRDSQ